MLPKSQRLNLKTDFKWVASGKKLDTKFLKLFIQSGDNKFARVGIATSSKTFPKAYQRNRARRLVSAAFEKVYPKLPSAINIVALPKSAVSDVKSDDLYLDIEHFFKNEKIID